jgi:CubicO group peptidase (beta-lactamase class C family)
LGVVMRLSSSLSARWVTTALALMLSSALALQAAQARDKDLPAAKPEKVGMSAERLMRLTEGMKQFSEQGRLSGTVTMVARQGKVVHFEASGMRDIAAGAPMQKDSIFRIYSMSKPITGVAMMMLFEEGKWQLNDPVSKHIPEFAGLKVYSGTDANGTPILKEQDRPMTMRDLMSHTAGFSYGVFSDTPVDKLQREADVLNNDITLDEMIKRTATLPLLYQPGARWHYSISVDIQGYLVQKLSGMRFEDFLAQRIFKPLNMKDTAFYVPQEKVSRFAEVYTYDKAGKLQPLRGGFNRDFTKPPMLPSGGGGLVSTASDYMRFCQMLLRGGEFNGVRLLSPRTVELMRTNVLPGNMPTMAPGAQFGLDFAVTTDVVAAGGYYGKGTFWWGGAAGTWFWIDPANELIMIGMIQQMGGTGATAVAGMPDVRGLSRVWTYQSIVE